jgi:hypothetical protein
VNYIAKLAVLALFLQSTTLHAGQLGYNDDPNPWGTFPKHFRIGKTLPFTKYGEGRIKESTIKNVVEQWNNGTMIRV